MARRVVWSARALRDVETIAEYIARDSPTYAGSVVKKIIAQTRILARFPSAGRKVPEFDDETMREVFAYSDRVIHRLEKDEVLIAAVIHGKRNL